MRIRARIGCAPFDLDSRGSFDLLTAAIVEASPEFLRDLRVSA
ncbi:MAG: hypothetical protein QOE68_574 [Thermoanaerobaculia bacterium]|jgi:hypothetical protein|nr:hypothetical protein [Thermoanaerobaculia bacterium]